MSQMRECPERAAQVGGAIAIAGTVAIGVAFAVATFGAGTPASVALIAAAVTTFATGMATIATAIAVDNAMDRHERSPIGVSARESLVQNRAEALEASRESRAIRGGVFTPYKAPERQNPGQEEGCLAPPHRV